MDKIKKFRDVSGRLEFFTKETENRTLVCSREGKALGFCDKDFTSDISGRKIAIGSDPAIVYNHKRKQDR